MKKKWGHYLVTMGRTIIVSLALVFMLQPINNVASAICFGIGEIAIIVWGIGDEMVYEGSQERP